MAGKPCACMVLAVSGRVVGQPAAMDASITEAAWTDPTALWGRIAPANRVILGAALWPILDSFQRTAARRALQRAWETCAFAAALHRLPPPPEPWRQP